MRGAARKGGPYREKTAFGTRFDIRSRLGGHLHGDDPPAQDDCKAHGCAFYFIHRGHQLATSLEGRDESKNKRRNHVGMVPVEPKTNQVRGARMNK